MWTEAINLAALQVISLYSKWKSCSPDGTQEGGGMSHQSPRRVFYHSVSLTSFDSCLACLKKKKSCYSIWTLINMVRCTERHGGCLGLNFQELSLKTKNKELKCMPKNDSTKVPCHPSKSSGFQDFEKCLFFWDPLVKLTLHKFRIEI